MAALAADTFFVTWKEVAQHLPPTLIASNRQGMRWRPDDEMSDEEKAVFERVARKFKGELMVGRYDDEAPFVEGVHGHGVGGGPEGAAARL